MMRAVGVAVVLGTLVACSNDDSSSSADAGQCEGGEGCACYGNGTCDDGLSCLSNFCVRVTRDASDSNASGNASAETNDDGVSVDDAQSDDGADSESDDIADDMASTTDDMASTADDAIHGGTNDEPSASDDTGAESTDDAEADDTGDALDDVADDAVSEESASSDVPDASAEDPAPMLDAGSQTDLDDESESTSTTDDTADDTTEIETSTDDTTDVETSTDAGGSYQWVMTGGMLDGNQGWSANTDGTGLNYDGHCLELWGEGKVDLNWDGPPEHPMLLDPTRYYEVSATGSIEQPAKFLWGVQYADATMPDAPQFYQGLNLLAGDFSTQQTFPGISERGRVSFRFNVLDATEPYGRFCLDSASLREVPAPPQ